MTIFKTRNPASLKKKDIFYNFYVCECLSMYGYMYLIIDAPGYQKRALYLLELELQDMGTWERNMSPQQEQSVLFTSKPPL